MENGFLTVKLDLWNLRERESIFLLSLIAHTSIKTTPFPFVFQPSMQLDVPVVPSLDRHVLGRVDMCQPLCQ